MSNQQESRAGSEVPATLPSSNPAIDAHGFDPAEYKWVPVRRRPRRDGWSPRKMVVFIQALSDTGCVSLAARETGMSVRSAYALRRAPGAEKFAAASEAAIGQAAHQLVDIAFDRAINGVMEPVHDRDGNCTGQRVRHSDRLLMFLMRAHFPERYRTAHANFRSPDEPLPARPEPVAQTITALQPVAPAQPHLLMDEDELNHQLDLADVGEDQVPHFQDDIPVNARSEATYDAHLIGPEEGDEEHDAADALEAASPFHPVAAPAPEPVLQIAAPAPEPAEEEEGGCVAGVRPGDERASEAEGLEDEDEYEDEYEDEGDFNSAYCGPDEEEESDEEFVERMFRVLEQVEAEYQEKS